MQRSNMKKGVPMKTKVFRLTSNTPQQGSTAIRATDGEADSRINKSNNNRGKNCHVVDASNPSFVIDSIRKMKKASSSTKKDGTIHQILSSWDSNEDDDDIIADPVALLAPVSSSSSSTSTIPSSGTGSIDGTTSAELYWYHQVTPIFGLGHRDLLAGRMFLHVWQTQGRDVALSLLGSVVTTEELHKATMDQFEKGCQLWGQDKHEEALWELQRVKTMLEVQYGTGLLHDVCRRLTTVHQHHINDENVSSFNVNYGNNATGTRGTASNNCIVRPPQSSSSVSPSSLDDPPSFSIGSLPTTAVVVSHTQLYYALGMVHLGLKEPTDALREFRRALQIGFLALGEQHHLTRATLYMIRTTLLTIGLASPKIQHYMDRTLEDLSREADGDIYLARGEWDMAVLEYANLRFLKDRDVQTQGRVRSKMATAFDQKGDRAKALELWSTVLALYAHCDTVGPDHALTQHVTKKFVDCRKRFCRLEI